MPTKRHNRFLLQMMDGVSNLRIVITEHSISSGEPWENIPDIIQKSGNTWEIDVQAGRHGTDTVAQWFKNKISGGNAIGCSSNDALPGKLNFAFTCTLSFDYQNRHCELYDIQIGQGHNSKLENNWWIGSRNLKKNSGTYILETGENIYFKCNILVSGVNQFYCKFNASEWMGKVNQKNSLKALSIPGTHDSGTYKISSAAFGARCQNYDIQQQLENGIRFLDIRLVNSSYSSDPLSLYHGIISCDVTFGEVLNACQTFLKNHPSETVLMSVNNEKSGQDISENFMYYLKKYNGLYYQGNSVPDLGQAKGKIVFFYRFDLNTGNSGIDKSKAGVRFGPWKDDVTFESENAQGQKFYIEDNYQSYDTHKKVKYVQENLERAVKKDSANESIMYVSFNSIAFGAFHHTPYQYAWGGIGVDPAMNPWLKQYTNYSGQRRLGIIPLDFYNNGGGNPIETGLVENIIKSNH
ncbi:phosphatidylinositol-specific phospholipase C [Chryseobacterium sp. MEBOG06]|uniref:phosphatidylinositol-specific phospholipase C n=1 Tax=Chryseobacterium sp. MEBOG06 TaxID=2879938 RepID=UPI001F1E21C1|nr:phosphatidylinositol-specific phospholipase C [Chryseobacterium sp. MEBOG06]UKB85446.1 phosphatidylinositol-specific phospholipase C [Chryseobacterium sp. MEBOG06]